jgi:hypothetical protein
MKFLFAGYKLVIEPVWKEITTFSDPKVPDINVRPATKEMNVLISDEDEAIKAIREFFKLPL